MLVKNFSSVSSRDPITLTFMGTSVIKAQYVDQMNWSITVWTSDYLQILTILVQSTEILRYESSGFRVFPINIVTSIVRISVIQKYPWHQLVGDLPGFEYWWCNMWDIYNYNYKYYVSGHIFRVTFRIKGWYSRMWKYLRYCGKKTARVTRFCNKYQYCSSLNTWSRFAI